MRDELKGLWERAGRPSKTALHRHAALHGDALGGHRRAESGDARGDRQKQPGQKG